MLSALSKGDVVVIVSPAKQVPEEKIDTAVAILTHWGLTVEVGQFAKGQHFYFSGTDEERQSDMQWALNHPTAKAIICARGGYGSVRIVKQLDYSAMAIRPKWLLGFSDITVFHHQWQQLQLPSIHSTVPLMFSWEDMAHPAMQSMRMAMFGVRLSYEWDGGHACVNGKTMAPLVGGNLAIIESLLGTSLALDMQDCILFIEDVGEYGYKLDRMLWSLQLAGKFAQIKGLIIGGMTDMKECEQVLGMDVFAILQQFSAQVNGPVAFHFPAGHISDNRALKLGVTYTFEVVNGQASLYEE